MIISVEGARKTFIVRARAGRVRREKREVRAVDGVSFTVAAGEMVGYLGPNGAGKSTTVKMLTGILMPSGGSLRVCGLDPVRQRIALTRRIGVVFGQRTQLWWDLPLRDSFELLRHIYRVSTVDHARRLDECVSLLEMGPFLDTPVRQLSLGQRMRGDLTAALLHHPEVVFLDEPTIGLDVVAKAQTRAFLARLNRDEGTTVILTTHDLSDVQRLCARMLIIDHGRVIHDGPVAGFADAFGGERTLVVDLEEEAPPLAVPGARVEKVEGPRQWLRFKRAEVSASDLIAAVAARARVVDLALEEPDIEEIVRGIYTRQR